MEQVVEQLVRIHDYEMSMQIVLKYYLGGCIRFSLQKCSFSW